MFIRVFPCFTLFFRENVGKMWAKIGCREWCGYGVSGFLRLLHCNPFGLQWRSRQGKEVNMQQVTELLKAAGEFLAGLGAVIAPIATVVIALHRKPEPRRPPRRRRRR